MISRRTFITAASAFAFGSSGAAAAPLLTSPAGLIFVEIDVNGRKAKALIDTGSVRGMQLTRSLADELKLQLADTGRRTQRYQGQARPILGARLQTFAVDSMKQANAQVFVSPGDIEDITSQIGETFDAILGWPLLAETPFVIDYSAGTFETRTGSGLAGLVVTVDRARNVPVTAGRLEGAPMSFLIDTGAPRSSVDRSAAGSASADSVPLEFEIGGQAFEARFRRRDLSAMTSGNGARAVIGHDFLKRFVVEWRPRQGVFQLRS